MRGSWGVGLGKFTRITFLLKRRDRALTDEGERDKKNIKGELHKSDGLKVSNERSGRRGSE